MKIGFDARMITHPGIGRYISSLLPELIKQSPEDEFVLFGERGQLSGFARESAVRIIEWTAPVYSPWEQFFNVICPRDIDLLHVPHFNIPLLFKKPMVVTIHDLIYLLFPGSITSGLGRRYAGFMISSAVKRSSGIISVSKHTRDDLVRFFGERWSDKIDIIHEAPHERFRRVEDKARIADVRCRYRLRDKIILYVGSIKPHKNVASLIKMYALLKNWGIPHQLVICGRWDKKEDHIKDSLSDSNVKYLGEVPSEDLAALYSMAGVLVHLSFYEGFGLTVLEAMQCGTPVVVSDTSSLPEIVGKAAYTVPPDDIVQAAEIVYNILMNVHLKEGMSELGIEHVRKFSWSRAAAETISVYKKVSTAGIYK